MFSTRSLSSRPAVPPAPRFCFVMALAKPWSIGSACSNFSPPMALHRWSLTTPVTAKAPAGRIGSSLNLTRWPPLLRLKSWRRNCPCRCSASRWAVAWPRRSFDRIAAHRLILCEAFTSFRHAAVSVGIPRRAFPSRPAHLACAATARAVQAPGPHRPWREGPAVSRCDGARTGRLVRAASGGRCRPQHHAQPALPQAAPFLLGPDHRMAQQIAARQPIYDPPRSGSPSSRRSRSNRSSWFLRSSRSSCSRRFFSSSRSSRPSAIRPTPRFSLTTLDPAGGLVQRAAVRRTR